ncbi:MAG: cytochrome c biogenesis protein CcsA [Acidilobaceae archaeon]
MSLSRNIIIALLLTLLLVDSVTVTYSIFKGSFPSIVERGAPTAYRNLYVHVPVSVGSYIVLTIAAVLALLFLLTRRSTFYFLSDSSIKIGIPLALASFLTGSIWAMESWGALWSWDPRQVSILFLLIAYTLYFAVKNSVRDPDRRPSIAMAYAFAVYATVPLSFIIPRIVESLHPTPEQTREFIAGDPQLFLSRLFILSLISITIILLAYTYKHRVKSIESKIITYTPLIIVLLPLTIISLYGLTLSLGLVEPTGKVLDARVENDKIWLKIESKDSTIEGYYTGRPPITPLEVEISGERKITLIDNIVAYSYSDGFFTKLRVVNHPVVYINTIIYAILLPLAVIASTRGERLES